MIRIAPVGLHAICVAPPRVWSPLQGYAPWALKRVAPLGLAQPLSLPSKSGTEYSSRPSPHVAALAPIWDKGCPCRASCYLCCCTQGLVAPAGLRTLGFDSVAPLGLAQPSVAPAKHISRLYIGVLAPQLKYPLEHPAKHISRLCCQPCSPTGAAIKPFSQARLGMYSHLASFQLVDKGAKPL